LFVIELEEYQTDNVEKLRRQMEKMKTKIFDQEKQILKVEEKLTDQLLKHEIKYFDEEIKKIDKSVYNMKSCIDLIPAGFSLLMKLHEEEFCYSSKYWTTQELLNISSTDPTVQAAAKFDDFNTRPISKLLIVDESGRFSVLELPQKRTLLSIFTSEDVLSLKMLAGCKDPYELVTGFQGANSYEPYWRTNSGFDNDFKVRVGGHYYFNWGKSKYGRDKKAYECGAEIAGAGLEDKRFNPFIFAKKSFGIRSAHDVTKSPDGQNGNVSRYAVIYGA